MILDLNWSVMVFKLSTQPLTLPIEITLGEGWWLWLPGEALSPESIFFTTLTYGKNFESVHIITLGGRFL